MKERGEERVRERDKEWVEERGGKSEKKKKKMEKGKRDKKR